MGAASGQTADTPLTLPDAVRTALANSPKLRAARFEAQAAQTQAEREKPISRPNVTLQASGTVQGPTVTFPRPLSGGGLEPATVLPNPYNRVEITLEQPLYRAGLGAARSRYAAQTQATLTEYRRAENDTVRDVRRAFFQVLSTQTLAAVAQEGVTMAQRQMEQTRLLLQAGSVPERDVLAAEADLAEAEQGAIRAANGLALAKGELNRLLGRNPATPFLPMPPDAVPPLPPDTNTGIAEALERRPELRGLTENLRAAKAGASLARAQDQPSLSARATVARQTPSAFAAADYYVAGLTLSWSPFDRGKTRADVQEATARIGQLESLRTDAELGIRLEVEKAWRDMRDAQARLDSATRQVTSAEAALTISQLRYQARSATQLEVSGALFSVLKARSSRVQATYDLHTAAAEYAHATGADVPTLTRPLRDRSDREEKP